MAKRFGFPPSERLKSRKQIEALFAGGKSFLVFPVRVTYRLLPSEPEGGLQVGVTASKRYFKKATDRNRLKRLLREACRLQKAGLVRQLTEKKIRADVFFMYTGKTVAPFADIEVAVAKCLKRLSEAASHENPS